MNDAETEARRLLAAATEDMPPGIDLLGGFVAARRRDRARRTRGRVVLSAGAAAAAALGTAVALTIGSAPPALAAVTSALTRTLTQSYHLTEQDSGYSRNARFTQRINDTCTTEADPVRHLTAFSCSDGTVVRRVGSYLFTYFTHPVGRGKHWVQMPLACLINVPTKINPFTTATPQQMLSEIKKAGTVTVVGPASGPGWTGTRYAFSGRPMSGVRTSGTVDVDQQGRTRSLIATARATGYALTQALMFSDFGARVTVTPPPPDQTTPRVCRLPA
jgi:hypothetical protein